jgi:hypothetical protein
MPKAPQAVQQQIALFRQQGRTYTGDVVTHAAQQSDVPMRRVGELVLKIVGDYFEKVLDGVIQIVNLISCAFQSRFVIWL